MSDIVIGAATISGFQPSGIGTDLSLTGMTVTLGLTTVTGTNFLPQSVVGLGGFKITFSTGVAYTVATVTSRSALTLTTAYAESSGTVTGTLHKFVHLRVYVTAPFTPSGETYVAQSGAPGSSAWFRRYGVSVITDGAQNVAHIPQITLPATTNSNVQTARYFAGLYTAGGAFIQAYPGCVSDFRLDSATTPTSWPQICTFNSPPNPGPPTPINYYTTTQIDARLPSGSANQLLYYKTTGNVLHTLSLDTAFTITSDTLFLAGPSGVNRVQEEGSNLPQRQTINFVGTSFTAADDAGNSRTNITADADLDALASNSTNGIWARTGAGTGAARTLQAPAAGFTITNPAGTAGDPTFVLANDLNAVEGLATTGLATRTAANTWTTRTLTQPAAGITITNPAGIAGDPTLVLANDLAAVEGLASNGAAFRTGVDTWSVATGASTDGTNVTFGSTNLRATRPRITTSIDDSSGNEVIETPATGSAVNQLRATNSATGNAVSLSAQGDDGTVQLNLASKSTASVVIQTNATDRLVVTNTPEAYLGNGTVNASPAGAVILGTGGSGSNIAGANLDISGGKGTGNAIPGLVSLRYPLKTASGSTLQNLSTQRFPISTNLYTNTTNGTSIANTVTETSLFTGATAATGGTLTIEAGSAAAGSLYRLHLDAPYATTGTPTIRWRVKLGATSIGDSTAFNATTGTANGRSFLDAYIHVDSIGAAGSVRLEIWGTLMPINAGTAAPVFFVGSLGAVAIDFTANQLVDVTIQWGTASASNVITLQRASLERLR